MYIPFDNLYEWIACLEQNTVIYRFFPAGSKNLDDLQLIDKRYVPQQIPRLLPVVCHDQEPLCFDQYENDHVITRQMHKRIDPKKYAVLGPDHGYWKAISRNLRSALCPGRFDKYVLLHSEKRSPELQNYADHAVPAFWWSHALIALDWYRFAQHDCRLGVTNPEVFEKDFNVYARAWTGTREYRLALLSLLQQTDTLHRCRVSFSHRDSGVYFRDHVFTNRDLDLDFDGAQLEPTEISSCRSAHYDIEHYAACAIDVVLETVFDDPRLHLTEKILRPIACAKPFLLVSTVGALQYLKDYGFETFDGLIDESYDEISDPLPRLRAIASEMSRISRLSASAKKTLYGDLYRIAQRNQTRFFSQSFADHVVTELRQNLAQAIHEVRSNWGDAQLIFGSYTTLTEQEKIQAEVKGE